MTEIQRIEDQLRRSHSGVAWVGPCLDEVLAGLTAEDAASHPVLDAHSIWEIVLHLAAWENMATRTLGGDVLDGLPEEEDWPAIEDPTAKQWESTLQRFTHTHGALRAAIRKLTDDRLDDKVSASQYPIYYLLHGIVQHNLYHAGQIALLRKALL